MEELQFVPAVMDAVVPPRAAGRDLGQERKATRCKAKLDAGIIKIEVDGITTRRVPN
ncbi:hypothetical protein JIR23_22230 [Bradyrhizobium diazoefficiens]|nr:hypothetical protein [Bradyrhizobium diazoefficiens]QQN62294.1 hypothetical protein JIR23_22230 [Bradyrhizobium diazoefficiens]